MGKSKEERERAKYLREEKEQAEFRERDFQETKDKESKEIAEKYAERYHVPKSQVEQEYKENMDETHQRMPDLTNCEAAKMARVETVGKYRREEVKARERQEKREKHEGKERKRRTDRLEKTERKRHEKERKAERKQREKREKKERKERENKEKKERKERKKLEKPAQIEHVNKAQREIKLKVANDGVKAYKVKVDREHGVSLRRNPKGDRERIRGRPKKER